MKLPRKNGFSPVILIVFIALVLAVATFILLNNKSQTKITPQTLIQKIEPTPTPSPWKTYSTDGYVVTYPAQGVVVDETGTHAGLCGNAIKDGKVDNFFTIKVIPWTKTIADYMAAQGAAKIYDTHAITGTGADEALALDNLAKGVEYARGFPPMAYIKALYKKGNNLFLMQAFQTPSNLGGCVLPANVDPIKYADILKLNWDPLASIKFTP